MYLDYSVTHLPGLYLVLSNKRLQLSAERDSVL
jgi:hypothetical protein